MWSSPRGESSNSPLISIVLPEQSGCSLFQSNDWERVHGMICRATSYSMGYKQHLHEHRRWFAAGSERMLTSITRGRDARRDWTGTTRIVLWLSCRRAWQGMASMFSAQLELIRCLLRPRQLLQMRHHGTGTRDYVIIGVKNEEARTTVTEIVDVGRHTMFACFVRRLVIAASVLEVPTCCIWRTGTKQSEGYVVIRMSAASSNLIPRIVIHLHLLCNSSTH